MGKFVIRRVKTGIMFNLKAGNGEVIATSEVYNSMESCKKGIASVQRNAPIAAVENQTVPDYKTEKHPKFEVYTDKAGEFRFRLKAKNGQIIAVGEGYKALASCMNGVESIKKNAVDAKIVEEEKKEDKKADKKTDVKADKKAEKSADVKEDKKTEKPVDVKADKKAEKQADTKEDTKAEKKEEKKEVKKAGKKTTKKA